MGALKNKEFNISKLGVSPHRAYEYLGAHKEGRSYAFRVFAPRADRVFLIGDFCSWDDRYPMEKNADGVFEISLDYSLVKSGDKYKYKIQRGDKIIYKSDPYGYMMEHRPEFASIVSNIDKFKWHDSRWLERRKSDAVNIYHKPLNIYEIHLGSWRRRHDGSYLSYPEIARELAPYVKQMGYTHIELMPISEYPSDASWGYQVGGYFSPTSRYGNPAELMEFIDVMHCAGIGVILDWVPAHFPSDSFGLCDFDGDALYEYPAHECRSMWETRFFDLSKDHVKGFLLSNADFWIRKYHVDGLRVDAVGSILALDESIESEEHKQMRGANAKEFLQAFNAYIKSNYPDVLTIAEDSSAQKHITGFDNDGLGFDLKWNMGWMYDTLSYAEKGVWDRKYHHGKLNFSLSYAFDEQFVLPISHDDVTGGKRAYLTKMPDDRWRKFAGARVFYAYQMTHPGKKLNFMGNEIASVGEWMYDRGLEWRLLEDELHAKYQYFCEELNNLYLSRPELWQCDDSWDGFQWIDADDSERSILSYRRIARDGSELIVILNFTPNTYEEFFIDVPKAAIYKEIFNSDDVSYGGSGVTNHNYLKSFKDGGKDRLRMRLSPMGATILSIVG
ncbi:MAG: 1,4-alpha-glucan branching protein GlgB [Clostridia bacterium]|nr:1,4-alpha-glucan branching protein GlgB [Clostridia bacterium]